MLDQDRVNCKLSPEMKSAVAFKVKMSAILYWNVTPLVVVGFTGDEMLSDAFVLKEVEGVLYEVEGKVS